jgi:hypothetical protein
LESGRPIAHVAKDLGVPPETLRQVQADEGLRPDLPTARTHGASEEIDRRSWTPKARRFAPAGQPPARTTS